MSEVRVSRGGNIIRYTLGERIVHWAAGLSYVYLLLTGLALYTPHLFWLATVLGGGPTVRIWHPIAGLVLIVTVAWMYGMWHADMRFTAADRAWSRALGDYVRNQEERVPPAGRFNPGQKLLFWLMFYGGLVLLLSGTVLWFPEVIPWSLRWLRYAAVIVHVAAALLTMGGFIVHVYMGVVVVPGGLHAIIRGEVSERWARAHHRLWTEELTQRRER